MVAMAAKGNKASAMAQSASAAKRNEDLLPVIAEIRGAGAPSLGMIAKELNARGITTARGGQWAPAQVLRILRNAVRPAEWVTV
jgi:hypothetical protein